MNDLGRNLGGVKIKGMSKILMVRGVRDIEDVSVTSFECVGGRLIFDSKGGMIQ